MSKCYGAPNAGAVNLPLVRFCLECTGDGQQLESGRETPIPGRSTGAVVLWWCIAAVSGLPGFVVTQEGFAPSAAVGESIPRYARSLGLAGTRRAGEQRTTVSPSVQTILRVAAPFAATRYTESRLRPQSTLTIRSSPEKAVREAPRRQQ
jgi:hypothetical protein